MKLEKPSADREAYYAEAASWAKDVHGSLRASRRVAWIIATTAVVVAALEALAIVSLAPLKTVVPYTITVDRQTGYLETAPVLAAGALAQDAAVTHAFLAQYVLARETYDPRDVQPAYQKVTAWSQGPARSQYIAGMAPQNPQSPTNIYTDQSVVKTTVKSISLLSKESALVRFETERTDGAVASERRAFAAVVGFRYTGQPMRMEDRILNPLGFQVTSYRRDAETIVPPPAPAPPTGPQLAPAIPVT